MFCNQKIGILNLKDLSFQNKDVSMKKDLPSEIIFYREVFLFIKRSVYQKLYPMRSAKSG